MPRDSSVYLQDVLDAIRKVREYTKGCTAESFVADEMLVDAVIRNLEVIGEAVKNVPDEVRNRCPEIEWRKVAGLRDILIHEYFGIDKVIVWDIVSNKLGDLEARVRGLLNQ